MKCIYFRIVTVITVSSSGLSAIELRFPMNVRLFIRRNSLPIKTTCYFFPGCRSVIEIYSINCEGNFSLYSFLPQPVTRMAFPLVDEFPSRKPGIIDTNL